MAFKIMALILARGGSKRIPDKNIKNFLGKPLIAYAIEQARSCELIDRVFVDTDSPRIARVARQYGALVPWLRPKKFARDNSQAIDTILYNLRKLKEKENYQPDYIMIMQATTSPMREKEDLLRCWQIMQKTGASTIVTVCPTQPRLYHLSPENKLILANKKKIDSSNSQDWQSGYKLDGKLCLSKVKAVLKEKTVFTKDIRAVVCPAWRSVDLDTYEDWAMAEFLYKNKKMITKRIGSLKKTGNSVNK